MSGGLAPFQQLKPSSGTPHIYNIGLLVRANHDFPVNKHRNKYYPLVWRRYNDCGVCGVKCVDSSIGFFYHSNIIHVYNCVTVSRCTDM